MREGEEAAEETAAAPGLGLDLDLNLPRNQPGTGIAVGGAPSAPDAPPGRSGGQRGAEERGASERAGEEGAG